MSDHPITPPPELIGRWEEDWHHSKVKHIELEDYIATCAAQWGADQELEACCAIALTDPVCGTKHQRSVLVRHMREQRRPKPPSLKEQALTALRAVALGANNAREQYLDLETIRQALEQLDD
jgi:hypothetical protein